MLASFGGDNDDPDMLRLRPGDAVEFEVDARPLSSKSPLVSQLNADHQRSFDEQVAEIRQSMAGKTEALDEDLIRVLVASLRSVIVSILKFFRVTNVMYSWSDTDGVEVAFDFQNYFTPRSNVTPQDGPNREEPVRKSSRRATAKPRSRKLPQGSPGPKG